MFSIVVQPLLLNKCSDFHDFGLRRSCFHGDISKCWRATMQNLNIFGLKIKLSTVTKCVQVFYVTNLSFNRKNWNFTFIFLTGSHQNLNSALTFMKVTDNFEIHIIAVNISLSKLKSCHVCKNCYNKIWKISLMVYNLYKNCLNTSWHIANMDGCFIH